MSAPTIEPPDEIYRVGTLVTFTLDGIRYDRARVVSVTYQEQFRASDITVAYPGGRKLTLIDEFLARVPVVPVPDDPAVAS